MFQMALPMFGFGPESYWKPPSMKKILNYARSIVSTRLRPVPLACFAVAGNNRTNASNTTIESRTVTFETSNTQSH